MNFSLPARPPFSLQAVLNAHGWRQLAPFAGGGEADQPLTFVHQLAHGRIVAPSISAIEGGVLVESTDELSGDEQSELAHKVRWMLALDQDLTPFYDHARDEPKLANVAREVRGRFLRSPTFFEDTVKTILTTNTAWSGTIRMNQALVDHFGTPYPADPARHAFPTAQQLAATSEEALRSSGKLGYRAPYVHTLARAVADGALDIEGFKTATAPTPELRKRLLAIKGVGNYAAASLLLLLGRYDYIPIDSWALKLVSREWHDGQPVTATEVKAAFAGWGHWKALAYWLWDWRQD